MRVLNQFLKMLTSCLHLFIHAKRREYKGQQVLFCPVPSSYSSKSNRRQDGNTTFLCQHFSGQDNSIVMAITFLRMGITDITFHPLLILGKRYTPIDCLPKHQSDIRNVNPQDQNKHSPYILCKCHHYVIMMATL